MGRWGDGEMGKWSFLAGEFSSRELSSREKN
jgi:hypothetical protein